MRKVVGGRAFLLSRGFRRLCLAALGTACLLSPWKGVRHHGCLKLVAAADDTGEKPSGPPPLNVDKDAPRLDESAGKEAEPSARSGADNSACYVCHANYKEEPFAQRHAKASVGCAKCHGESRPHQANEENTTPPDVMFPPEEIAPFCAKCHETHNAPAAAVIARWQQRCPKKANPKAILCTDCHGEHRLRIRTVRWDRRTRKLIVGNRNQRAGKGEGPARKPARKPAR